MMLTYIVAAYVLMALSTFLVSANNLSLIVGPVVGSRLIRPQAAILMTVIGYVAGLVIQGRSMNVYSVGDSARLVLFAVSLVVFTIGEGSRIPMSITNSLYMSINGIHLVNGYLLSNFYVVIGYWFLTPILIAVFSYVVYLIIRYYSAANPIRYIAMFKILMIILSFMVAFSFGANNLGLVWALSGPSIGNLLLISAIAVLGAVIGGRRTLGAYGRMYGFGPLTGASAQLSVFIAMEVATFLAIPMTLTLSVTGALLGLAFAHRFRFINANYVYMIIMGYFASLLLSLSLAFIIYKLLI